MVYIFDVDILISYRIGIHESKALKSDCLYKIIAFNLAIWLWKEFIELNKLLTFSQYFIKCNSFKFKQILVHYILVPFMKNIHDTLKMMNYTKKIFTVYRWYIFL